MTPLPPAARFAVLSFPDADIEHFVDTSASTFVDQATICCCNLLENPALLSNVAALQDFALTEGTVAQVLEQEHACALLVRSFELLVETRLLCLTCQSGKHRSGTIAAVLADWSSRLLGPTIVRHSYAVQDRSGWASVVHNAKHFVLPAPCSGQHNFCPVLINGKLSQHSTADSESFSHEMMQIVAEDPWSYFADVDALQVKDLPRGLDLLPALRLDTARDRLASSWQKCCRTAAITSGSFRHMALQLRRSFPGPMRYLAVASPAHPCPPRPPAPPRATHTAQHSLLTPLPQPMASAVEPTVKQRMAAPQRVACEMAQPVVASADAPSRQHHGHLRSRCRSHGRRRRRRTSPSPGRSMPRRRGRSPSPHRGRAPPSLDDLLADFQAHVAASPCLSRTVQDATFCAKRAQDIMAVVHVPHDVQDTFADLLSQAPGDSEEHSDLVWLIQRLWTTLHDADDPAPVLRPTAWLRNSLSKFLPMTDNKRRLSQASRVYST